MSHYDKLIEYLEARVWFYLHRDEITAAIEKVFTGETVPVDRSVAQEIDTLEKHFTIARVLSGAIEKLKGGLRQRLTAGEEIAIDGALDSLYAEYGDSPEYARVNEQAEAAGLHEYSEIRNFEDWYAGILRTDYP